MCDDPKCVGFTRFPEAAPEPKMGETLHTCTMGPGCPNHPTFVSPTPSAPAEPGGEDGRCVHSYVAMSGVKWRCRLSSAHLGTHDYFPVLATVPAAPPSEAPATASATAQCGVCHWDLSGGTNQCYYPLGHVGRHSWDSSGGVAAARPEAEDPNRCDFSNGLGQCVLLKGHQMPHMGAEDCKPSCAACACERCQERAEAFKELARAVVALADETAKWEGGANQGVVYTAWVWRERIKNSVAAARKVNP